MEEYRFIILEKRNFPVE